MNDWFEWNGTRSTQYGIYVLEQPTYTLPAERVTFTTVPGRSGTLTTLEGDSVYSDVTHTATCLIDSESRIPNLTSWLRGSGNVTFANRPGGYYKARIINQIAFDKILRGNPHRKFAVNFYSKPFWYHSSNAATVLTESGFVTNPGNVFSEPTITVTGSGDITLMVGGTLIELEDVDTGITIDSSVMEAYQGSMALNDKMTGDFPVLQPGITAISWDGNVSSVSILGNWRSL